jgi:hypothetical protein
MGTSPAEIAVRVVAGLLDISERCVEATIPLTAAVATAVEELDPGHERDTRPTWLQELPPWARLDAFDRLRKADDDLRLLEVEAAEVVKDLRESFTTPNPAHRPLGLSPGKAHAMLARQADRRAEIMTGMALAERSLRPQLTVPASAALRRAMRRLCASETAANERRAGLGFLLAARQVGPSQPRGMAS